MEDSVGVTSYSYDGVGRRTAIEDAIGNDTTFVYDAVGQMTALVDQLDQWTTYSWDVENHMTLVELSDATLNTMAYDGDGKRRQYEDSAGLRNFIWDGENIARQMNRDYTYNPQAYGELIAMGADANSYFLTCCTHHRHPILCKDGVAEEMIAFYAGYRGLGGGDGFPTSVEMAR